MPNRAGCIKIKFPYCITRSVAGFLVTGVMNIDTLQLNKMPEHYSRQQMLISSSENILFSNSNSGAHSGLVVKALHYKPVGRRFDSSWCH